MYKITLCSPQGTSALLKHRPTPPDRWDTDYPFGALEVGYSFTVSQLLVSENSLRSLSATAGTILRRRFKTFKHSALDLIEVVRLE